MTKKKDSKDVVKNGCPTKYKEEYCQMLEDHMAKGLSFMAFAAIVGTHRDTLYEWGKVHKEFSDSIRTGKARMSLFFEKMGIAAMAGKVKNFNSSVYIFTLKNKLAWSDKQDVSIDGANITINISESDSKL